MRRVLLLLVLLVGISAQPAAASVILASFDLEVIPVDPNVDVYLSISLDGVGLFDSSPVASFHNGVQENFRSLGLFWARDDPDFADFVTAFLADPTGQLEVSLTAGAVRDSVPFFLGTWTPEDLVLHVSSARGGYFEEGFGGDVLAGVSAPEPSTCILLGTGVAVAWRRRRSR